MSISMPVSLAILACVNTTYSAADEREITNDLRLLVVGAFAHHGPAFYEHEVERCLAVLATAPRDFDARNDLGAALTKLGRYDEAEARFLENEEFHPGKYRTASNLGVLYKKWSRLDDAEEWVGRALAIRPGGHMGLGDYYLRMIQWRKNKKDAVEAPARNFLGHPYTAGWSATAESANREFLITLIKNDMHFSDAYVVLGEVLFAEKDYRTAARSYARALFLGHSWALASERYEMARAKLEDLAPFGTELKTQAANDAPFFGEFDTAQGWLEEYQALERDRLEQGLPVDFAAMKPALVEAGIVPLTITEVYRGTWLSKATNPAFLFWTFLQCAIAVVSLLFLRQMWTEICSKPEPASSS